MITIILVFVVGFVLGAVAMILYSTNKKKPSANSDDIEGVLDKCKEDINRISRSISRIEKEINENSLDVSHLRGSIKELEEKSALLSVKASNFSNAVNAPAFNQNIATPVQENPVPEVMEKTSVAVPNQPQQSFVQNNTAINNRPQSPGVSASGASGNVAASNVSNVYSMQQIFQVVKSRQESSPEYRAFNFQTNKIEYSNDKSAQYILSENKRYLIPNFTGPFQKSSLSDAVYVCNTDLIYGTNKITLCEVDSNGQVIKKGTIS